MITVTCTKGEVTVYPSTGLDLKIGTIPLVADPTGPSSVLVEGESMEINPDGHPAIGGRFGVRNSSFTITNKLESSINIIHWHEEAEDDDTGLDYIDLTGRLTDDNYTELTLESGESHDTEVTKSNVLTISVFNPQASTLPV